MNLFFISFTSYRHAGFPLGFRIPCAVFLIPKPKIPDSGISILLHRLMEKKKKQQQQQQRHNLIAFP